MLLTRRLRFPPHPFPFVTRRLQLSTITIGASYCDDMHSLLSATTVLVPRTSPDSDAGGSKFILITVSMKEFLATLIAQLHWK